MTLQVNQLLAFLDDPKIPTIVRVLHIEAQIRKTALISIDSSSGMPYWENTDVLEVKIREKTIIILQSEHALPRVYLEDEIDEKIKARRDAAWESIAPLFTNDNRVKMLYPHERAKLINTRVSETKISKITLYSRIRRYWQRGQTKNTQLPDFLNCGRNGKNRKIGEKKVGRPSLLSKHEKLQLGVNIDQDKKKIIIAGAKLFYERETKPSYPKAHRDTLRNFCKIGYEEKDGVQVPLLPPKTQLLTLNQFKYHYQQYLKVENRLKKAMIGRYGERKFNLCYREVIRNSTREAFGPGSIFQVDSTIADAYFRSRYNPNNIIQRLTIWVVIDVFSRLIVGFCIRPEREGWHGLSIAIENAATDKVKYCAQYGIKIEKEDWPSGLCEGLIGDAVLKNPNTDNLTNNLNISILNTPPYRADWKGIVEHYFHYLNVRFIHQQPGAVDKDHGRGDIDYRLLSALNIDDFTRIAIKVILEYNKWQYLEYYDLDEFMIHDDVKPYPIDLWNWGIKNRQGSLRTRDPETIRINLLPSAIAKVTEKGIRFEGEFYTCEQASREGWFLRARQDGVWELPIVYDPRKPDMIYLRPRNGVATIQCHLINPNSPYRKFDFAEIVEYREYKKVEAQRSESDRLQAAIETDAYIEDVNKKAIKRTQDAAIPGQSKRSQTSAIRENTKIEKAKIHQEETKKIYGLDSEVGDIPKLSEDDEYVPLPHLNKIDNIRERMMKHG